MVKNKKLSVDNSNVATENNNLKEKNNKKAQKTKKSGKPGFFSRVGAKIKDVFSELKKVNWPSFSKVVKQTGVVLAVVLLFLVIITAFDFGLYELLKLVSPKG